MVEVLAEAQYKITQDMIRSEQGALPAVLDLAKTGIEGRHQPDGYNVGMNCGEAAGQTVMHFHWRLIPRTHSDTPRPRGGVRGVIPSMQSYLKLKICGLR